MDRGINPEFLRPPIRIFEVKDSGQNNGEKLVRDGIFKIMQEEVDRPKIAEHAYERRSAIYRNKIQEEMFEFKTADTKELQIKEAGDFLAAVDLLAGESDGQTGLLLERFRNLLIKRGITIEEAEIARNARADEVGEYNGLYVVREVAPEKKERAVKFYASNDQWIERRVYYYEE